MQGTAEKVINITGTALILGLMLRWGPQAAALIGAFSSGASEFFKTVSLQGISAPADRA